MWGGWCGVGGLGGVEKLMLKLTSASTGVGVKARAEHKLGPRAELCQAQNC